VIEITRAATDPPADALCALALTNSNTALDVAWSNGSDNIVTLSAAVTVTVAKGDCDDHPTVARTWRRAALATEPPTHRPVI
jgi:hypothetical protein